MKQYELAIQVKSLRAQLDVLMAKLLGAETDDGRSFADLHGILADQCQTSVEEIDGILYRGSPADLE